MSAVYAYVRVSSTDQNEDRQLITMRDKKVPARNIFVDKQSGKDFNRPQYLRRNGNHQKDVEISCCFNLKPEVLNTT